MQTEPTIPRAANGDFAPLGMFDQGSSFDALGERPAIGRALPTFAWLKSMELAMMPGKRREAHQTLIIRGRLPPDGTIGQAPGINGVRFPYLCQLLAGFLEPQLDPQSFGLVALHEVKGSKLPDLLIKPVLAHFQRGKALVPCTLLFLILDQSQQQGVGSPALLAQR
jgi:hypothetical protein